MIARLLRPLAWGTAGLAIATAAFAVIADRPAFLPEAARLASAATPPAVAPATPTSAPDSDNPKVPPGLVRWHASAAAARVASERSGKPILVFHMMGQLDRQFC